VNGWRQSEAGNGIMLAPGRMIGGGGHDRQVVNVVIVPAIVFARWPLKLSRASLYYVK